ASAPRTIPMRLAQTMVDDPKYGARRRDEVISVARAPIPAPNTSAPSAKLPGRSVAADGGVTSLDQPSRARTRARSRPASAQRALPRQRRRGRARARSGRPPSVSHGGVAPSPRAGRGGAGTHAGRHRDRAGGRPREPSAVRSSGPFVPRGEF